ncbi:REP element-mobilizing transposase RayT [Abditibacterium utsteinense]|uniref:REP element-mobilizing transposase RayT n=1 Tax=Abditibacterium utsteinense TaxID=1960156 RepID=A0A2S8SR66_9BACT|nr:REP element-mobilizing transposase RayT [Abditibacterium utsteinense]
MGIVGDRIRKLLFEIAESYRIEIEELEVSVDYMHVFCSFAPKLSITQVVTRLKSLGARAIFQEQPQVKRQQVKRQLWGGEFWEDGYFARTVGDKITTDVITADVIKRYIQNHRDDTADDLQLKLFQPRLTSLMTPQCPAACGAGLFTFCWVKA